jgi:hypothetical protein
MIPELTTVREHDESRITNDDYRQGFFYSPVVIRHFYPQLSSYPFFIKDTEIT